MTDQPISDNQPARYTGPEVPDLSVEAEDGPGTLYLTGSQRWGNKRDFAVMAEFTRRAVDQAAEKDMTIMVGDSQYGVDGIAVQQANRLSYSNVVVVGMDEAPRNGGVENGQYVHIDTESVIERDRWMIDQADRGLVVSNGQDKGSYAISKQLEERGVPVDLIDVPRELEKRGPGSQEAEPEGPNGNGKTRQYTGPEVPDLSVEGSDGPGSIYIAGSRYFENKRDFAIAAEYTNRAVDQAMEKDMQIFVGDNPYGIDKVAVERANKASYENITVVGLDAEPRNGGAGHGEYVQVESESYADRDRWMAEQADRGLFVWNRESPETYASYKHMQGLGKPVDLARFGPDVQRERPTPKQEADAPAPEPVGAQASEQQFNAPDMDI